MLRETITVGYVSRRNLGAPSREQAERIARGGVGELWAVRNAAGGQVQYVTNASAIKADIDSEDVVREFNCSVQRRWSQFLSPDLGPDSWKRHNHGTTLDPLKRSPHFPLCAAPNRMTFFIYLLAHQKLNFAQYLLNLRLALITSHRMNANEEEFHKRFSRHFAVSMTVVNDHQVQQ